MTNATTKAALALAKAYAPDLIPPDVEPTISGDPLDAYVWENRPTLVPGLDYRDGVVYMTTQIPKPVRKQVGKGKDATFYTVNEPMPVCITSEREIFDMTEEQVYQNGFTYPTTFMPNTTGIQWDLADVKAFLRGETQSPDPFELYTDIRAVFDEYVEFAESRQADLMTIYTMLTYVFRIFNAVGYVHFNGTHNVGKSQNLKILNAIGFNPIYQGSTTPSALFRSIGGSCGTVLLDEAEEWKTDNQKELLQILKQGYQNGAPVMRTERDSHDRFRPVNYFSYSPKFIASIAPIDQVLQSRTITVGMRPALRIISEVPPKEDPRWVPLRSRLHLWAMHHTTPLAATAKTWATGTDKRKRATHITNRNWEIALPLLSIADYVAGEVLVGPLLEWLSTYWSERTRNDAATDKTALLMRCLPRVIANYNYIDDHWYLLKDIHGSVIDYIDEDQREFYKTRTVVRLLAPLGFTEKRSTKQGMQIRLDEQVVRRALLQRRIETFPEDVDWLTNEDKSYATALVAPLAASASIWTQGEEDEAG